MLSPCFKYLYVKWLEQQRDLHFFQSVSFPHEAEHGTVIKLAETLSGPVELPLVLVRLWQHGLQLQLTSVTCDTVKMTSVLIKAAPRNLERIYCWNYKDDAAGCGAD